PQAVLCGNRRDGGGQHSIGHAPRRHFEGVYAVIDGDQLAEPARRLAALVGVVGGEDLAVAVAPLETVHLRALYLLSQELVDRLVVADQRLLGNERREEGEGFRLLAQPPCRMFRAAFGY